MAEFVAPGQVLGSLSSHQAGVGTHILDNNILASIVGTIVKTAATSKSSRPSISVRRTTETENVAILPSSELPAVGSSVLCRVIRVQKRQLIASILVTNPTNTALIPYTTALDDESQFQAVLRTEDVRAYEKDKINMNEVYRVGDIIRAVVISLGDERSYYISTAGNEYGVVVATSEAGNAMIPASWKEMKDAVTGKGESRKVAKPA